MSGNHRKTNDPKAPNAFQRRRQRRAAAAATAKMAGSSVAESAAGSGASTPAHRRLLGGTPLRNSRQSSPSGSGHGGFFRRLVAMSARAPSNTGSAAAADASIAAPSVEALTSGGTGACGGPVASGGDGGGGVNNSCAHPVDFNYGNAASVGSTEVGGSAGEQRRDNTSEIRVGQAQVRARLSIASENDERTLSTGKPAAADASAEKEVDAGSGELPPQLLGQRQPGKRWRFSAAGPKVRSVSGSLQYLE